MKDIDIDLRDLFHDRIIEVGNILAAKDIHHKWLMEKNVKIESKIVKYLPCELNYLWDEYEETNIELEFILQKKLYEQG